MLAAFLLVFVVLPIVEIAVAIQVAHHIGGFNTIALLLVVSILGAWLARREGFSVLGRMRDQVSNGVVPTNEVIDTGLVFAGGVLLFVPGFVTGAFGLVLLFPPTRTALRGGLKRRFHGRVYRLGPGGSMGSGDIIDV